MKKLFSLMVGGLIFLASSCGGGWTDEQLNVVKNDCVMEGKYDCDCYVKKAKEMFKNPEEYNKPDSQTYQEFEKAIANCVVKDTTANDASPIESF